MTLAIASTSTYSDPTGVTSHVLTLPSGTAAGDLVRIFFIANGTPTITHPTNWAVIGSNTGSDSAVIYEKIVDASDVSAGTVTVGLSANQRATAVLERITGARNGVTSSEVAISSAVVGNTATPDPPSLNPGWGTEEILYTALTFAEQGGFTFNSYPTNYTLGQNNVQTGTGTGNAVSVASRLVTASSEDPGTFSTTTGRVRYTYTLAVRSAVGTAAMVGSTSLTFSTAGTIQGKAPIVGSTSLTFATTGAAVAKNYITGSTSLTFTPSGTMQAKGALVGSSPLTFTPAATIRGKGSIAGASSVAFTPGGSLRALAKAIGSSSITFAVTGAAAGKAHVTGSALFTFSLSGFVYVDNGPGKGRASALRPVTQVGVTASTGQTQVTAAGGRAGVSGPRGRASVSRASGRATVQ